MKNEKNDRVRFNLRQILTPVLLLAFSAASVAHADILFEGFAKITLGSTHVGYIVQRFDFDAKKKEFKDTYFFHTTPTGGDITESLVARTTSDFKPISYQYTSLGKDGAHTVDANFKGDTMTMTIRDGAKTSTAVKKVPKGVFLASFLNYIILQGKGGLKVGNKYAYKAIDEDDGGIYNGEAYVQSEEKVHDIATFKIVNTFRMGLPGEQHLIFNLTPRGEMLEARAPVENVQSEVVANIREATEGMSVNSKTIESLFGTFPRGAENAISRQASATKAPDKTTPADGKAVGANAAAETLTTPDSTADEKPAAPAKAATKSGSKSLPAKTTPPGNSDSQ